MSESNGWRECTIGDVVSLQRGYDLPEYQRKPGRVPVIGSFGITGYHDTAKTHGPGVTVGRSGASFGVVTFSPVDYWPHNAVLWVTDFKGNLPHFVYYFLKTIDFSNLNSGSAQPSLNRNYVYTVETRLPQPPTQRKIASILSAYDDLIENNSRRIAILEEMAQAIYREWFVNFRFPGHENVKLVQSTLGMIPEGWEMKCLSELGFIGRGKSRHRPRNAPELYGGPYPLFQTGDIKAASTFLWKHIQSYSEAGLAQSKLWEPGTLCITIAANIAETAILSKNACFPDSVVGFVSNPDHQCVYFVKLYLKTIKSQVQNVSRGTTQDNLSLEKLLSFKVPTPPSTLLCEFHACVTPVFDNVLCLAKKNDNLRATRDLLLPKLISGQLDVEDLDIETSERLVEAEA